MMFWCLNLFGWVEIVSPWASQFSEIVSPWASLFSEQRTHSRMSLICRLTSAESYPFSLVHTPQIEAMLLCLSHRRARYLAVRDLLSCWDCSNLASPKQFTFSSLAFPTKLQYGKKKKKNKSHPKLFPRPCFLLPEDAQESSPCVPTWRGVCLLSSGPVRIVTFVPEPLLLWPHLNNQLIKE